MSAYAAPHAAHGNDVVLLGRADFSGSDDEALGGQHFGRGRVRRPGIRGTSP